MKKMVIILMLIGFAFSQMSALKGDKKGEGSVLDMGIGYANVDGESYMMFNIAPDLSFGKFGVGLNLELMFGGDGGFKFRKDAYEGGAGWLRAIRYLRYGHKGEDVHARVGTIDNGTLGNGFLMFHYTNAADYDNRKIGAVLDLDFEDFGFESIYSNFGRPEIFGARAYYRPLVALDMPVISTLEAGLTYVSDSYANPNGIAKIARVGDTSVQYYDDKLSMFGFDIGMYLMKTKSFQWKTYFDYGSISDYGSGTAIGTSFNFGLAEAINFNAKYERRNLGDEFLPSIFSTLYETQKSQIPFHAILAGQKEISGNFFEVGASLLNTFHFTGNWQNLDDVDVSIDPSANDNGVFYGEVLIDADMPFELSARYYKSGLETLGDLTGFNQNSLAEFEVGYQINTYLFLTTTYRFSWVEKDILDADDEPTGDTVFKEQKRIIPKVSFRYNF